MGKAARSTLLAVCLAFSGEAAAQEAIHYGTLGGRVTDPQGAAVGGVEVTARQVETNVQQTAVTAADGRFRFPFLRVGDYEVRAGKAGFKATTLALTLNAGSAFQLPISLQVGRVEENVTVM